MDFIIKDFIIKYFIIKDFIVKDSRAEWSGMDFIGQLHIGPTAPAMERSGEQWIIIIRVDNWRLRWTMNYSDQSWHLETAVNDDFFATRAKQRNWLYTWKYSTQKLQ